MDNNYGFCPRCGANLTEGAEYCPQCGKSFVEDPRRELRTRSGMNPLLFFIILLTAYTVMSIFEGIYATVFSDMFIDSFKMVYGSDLEDYLARNGLESIDQFADLMFKEGIVSIIGGAITAVVLLLCIRRRFWKVAFALCIIASFELLISLVFMPSKMIGGELLTLVLQTAVGLLVARGIYMSRRMFN